MVSIRRGILFINIGSPSSLRISAVAGFLREFLMDRRVIDINFLSRFLLVNFCVVPFRVRWSRRAYQRIWREEGSPLLVFARAFGDKLQKKLPQQIRIAVAMRYGEPSISNAISELLAQGIEELTVFPLFPQYSSAASGSAIEAALRHPALKKTQVKVIEHYYDKEFYLKSVTHAIAAHLREKTTDFVLFSYHSLPVRQLPCQPQPGCCDRATHDNRLCYRFQCLQTTRAVSQRLGLSNCTTAFQSRLGRIPWIRPYTDEKIAELVQQGVEHLAVVCPGFAMDCFETLEEVGMRLRDDFKRIGGKSLTLIPCLNADERWLENLSHYLVNTE